MRATKDVLAEHAEVPPMPAAAASAPAVVPVQQTNILQILETHLPTEHAAVKARIVAIRDQLGAAEKYQAQLERIAAEAGVALA